MKDLVQNATDIKLNNVYEKEYINEFKILPNDVRLVDLFPLFINRVLKFVFDKAVTKTIF